MSRESAEWEQYLDNERDVQAMRLVVKRLTTLDPNDAPRFFVQRWGGKPNARTRRDRAPKIFVRVTVQPTSQTAEFGHSRRREKVFIRLVACPNCV